jgi:hypothetical protein
MHMRRSLIALAVLAATAGPWAQPPATAQSQSPAQSAAGRDPFAGLQQSDLERSRTAWVYLPSDGEVRISFNARWDTAVAIYRPGSDGRWQEVVNSTMQEKERRTTALKAGPYVVTAWARRSDRGANEAWRQSQYQLTGTEDGFRVGFNDGREPKFDDALVEFAWRTPGVVGNISSAPGTSGAATQRQQPAGSPAQTAGSPAQGTQGTIDRILRGAEKGEKGAR